LNPLCFGGGGGRQMASTGLGAIGHQAAPHKCTSCIRSRKHQSIERALIAI